ncbi:hypothetical protein [Actinobaculum sp. 352]|uniref:hypothetical protein n=1 Tax=Actinobaculum sp. 352 TaxID=2490946 RepID=UPI0019D174B9|nr:hypothetical protein [Actinobaculum sp. 352]
MRANRRDRTARLIAWTAAVVSGGHRWDAVAAVADGTPTPAIAVETNSKFHSKVTHLLIVAILLKNTECSFQLLSTLLPFSAVEDAKTTSSTAG